MLEIYLTGRSEGQMSHASGPLELGSGAKQGDVARWILDDPLAEADHLRIEELPGGLVRIENLGKAPIGLTDRTTLEPSESRQLKPPILLTLGGTHVDIEPGTGSDVGKPDLSALGFSVFSRGSDDAGDGPRKLRDLGLSPSPTTLARWFERVVLVQRSASGSESFYRQTADALIELLDLDQGIVLLRKGEDDWKVVAESTAEGVDRRPFSRTVLARLARERRTFYQMAALPALTTSLQGVEAVVASPIFDASRKVVGAVYGSRNRGSKARGIGIAPLEAEIVMVLASAVGVGLARLESEAQATRRRVQFERFFSADLALALERDSSLLEGRERVVTVLFADIRGFSRISEKLEATKTCEFIRDVMDRLTEQVRRFGGVVVDYAGDGLMAMWNAPSDQHDHASLACSTALAMLRELPSLSQKWESWIGGPVGLGVGVNTGTVIVGNTGSRYTMKYGPLGPPVNLGSRVESATKFFGVPALITGSTRERLGAGFALRRLCRARVVGIQGAVELYELHDDNSDATWNARRDTYEQGLELFESEQFPACCRVIHTLFEGQDGNYDVPSLHLVSRALQCLKSPPPSPFEPVIELTSK